LDARHGRDDRHRSIPRLRAAAKLLAAQLGAKEVRKGLLLTIEPTSGTSGRSSTWSRTPGDRRGRGETTAWFAIALPDGQYGIFDVFPDDTGRLAQLAGRVPRELVKNARSLVAGLPDMDMRDVLATKVGG
jgi:hypothetical protein